MPCEGIESHVRQVHGECILRQPELAQIVAQSLNHFDGDRYDLTDFVVMPNHVHLLVAFADEDSILEQCDSWKHFTATRINKAICRNGRFWQQDGFDHLVRTLEQFEYLRRYIQDNPTRAGLKLGEYIHWSNQCRHLAPRDDFRAHSQPPRFPLAEREVYTMYKIVLIPGDGIGPEVAAATQRVVDATGLGIEWQTQLAGQAALEKLGTPLPPETLAAVRAAHATLKGPTATPSGTGFRSVNVELRQKLQLYANYRPARSMPGVPSRYESVDLIVVRENTEGLYSGLEHEVVPGVVESLRVVTEHASERIARFAFETARRQGRKRVTCVHKANILKLSDGLFLRTCKRVAESFPDISFDDSIIDAAAMKLVLNPHSFDVMVMENLFGDIVSDLTAGLVGGLGLAPSANVGDGVAVFEAVHGTAPDIAGKGLANPTALILSAVLMLRYLNEKEAADRIENAVRTVLGEPPGSSRTVTGDLGGKANTQQYVDALLSAM
jgi:isocitrate dehydrogenase (NAD+)